MMQQKALLDQAGQLASSPMADPSKNPALQPPQEEEAQPPTEE